MYIQMDIVESLGLTPIPLKDYEPKRKRTRCIHTTKAGKQCECMCWAPYIKTVKGPIFYGDQLCGVHTENHREQVRKGQLIYERISGRNDRYYSYTDHDGEEHVVKRAQYYRAHREGKVAPQ